MRIEGLLDLFGGLSALHEQALELGCEPGQDQLGCRVPGTVTVCSVRAFTMASTRRSCMRGASALAVVVRRRLRGG
ncbi:hypothetical protein GCM10025789_11510 [Tessaracoccus lubricantis]|uniref:Uncharacterized protein n=1 Tax=Tessaracoccus lubricantis TaxID=545543 RepID=A0ABP9FGK0_9ACTN